MIFTLNSVQGIDVCFYVEIIHLMRVLKSLLSIVFFSCVMVWGVDGQTCCSGGVPVSSNLGLPSEGKNTLQFSLNYDLNVLETLKSGTEVLEDDSRSRRTHSILFQAGYSITERFFS